MTKFKAVLLSTLAGVLVAGTAGVVAMYFVAGFTWSAIHTGVSSAIYWAVVFVAYAAPPIGGLLAGGATYWLIYDPPTAPESGA